MEKHPDYIAGFDGSLKQLAAAIANMRYDKVGELFGFLSQEFYQQAEGDVCKRRIQLAALLRDADDECAGLKCQFEKIWQLCKPYMEKLE